MKKVQFLLVIMALTLAYPGKGADSNRLYTELGFFQNTYNQVRIPGDEGTQFNMRKSFPDGRPYFRLDYKKFFENNHGFRLLYAPLKLKGEHAYEKDIQFNGSVFNKNNETRTLYKFNSYRVSYFYQWIKNKKWKVNIGATAKIRDAQIALKQGSTKESRTDLGIVPLLYLWSEYWITESSKFTLDFDGLAAPQGRAFDVAIIYGYRLSPSVTANLGYRMLEGGADNEKVYTFAMFNYYFAGIELEF
jgi:hypothetical protein